MAQAVTKTILSYTLAFYNSEGEKADDATNKPYGQLKIRRMSFIFNEAKSLVEQIGVILIIRLNTYTDIFDAMARSLNIDKISKTLE